MTNATNTNYAIEIANNAELAEVRLNAFIVKDEMEFVAVDIAMKRITPFASLSLTNDDIDYLFDGESIPKSTIYKSEDLYQTFLYSYIPERVDEFFGSLNTYAKS